MLSVDSYLQEMPILAFPVNAEGQIVNCRWCQMKTGGIRGRTLTCPRRHLAEKPIMAFPLNDDVLSSLLTEKSVTARARSPSE